MQRVKDDPGVSQAEARGEPAERVSAGLPRESVEGQPLVRSMTKAPLRGPLSGFEAVVEYPNPPGV